MQFEASIGTGTDAPAINYRLTIYFFTYDFVNMNDKLFSVYLSDSSGSSLMCTSNHHDLVVSSDWKRLYFVFGSELFRETRRHHLASDVGWSSEVGFSALSTTG